MEGLDIDKLIEGRENEFLRLLGKFHADQTTIYFFDGKDYNLQINRKSLKALIRPKLKSLFDSYGMDNSEISSFIILILKKNYNTKLHKLLIDT